MSSLRNQSHGGNTELSPVMKSIPISIPNPISTDKSSPPTIYFPQLSLKSINTSLIKNGVSIKYLLPYFYSILTYLLHFIQLLFIHTDINIFTPIPQNFLFFVNNIIQSLYIHNSYFYTFNITMFLLLHNDLLFIIIPYNLHSFCYFLFISKVYLNLMIPPTLYYYHD